MGYRIVYGKNKRRISKGNKILTLSIFICVLLFVLVYYSGTELPSGALENMVEAVQDGETLSDAIVAFCQEIIDSAEMPQ